VGGLGGRPAVDWVAHRATQRMGKAPVLLVDGNLGKRRHRPGT
jgi:hypothetical protein